MYTTLGMLVGSMAVAPTLALWGTGGSNIGTARDWGLPASPAITAGQLIVHLVALSSGTVSVPPSGYTRFGSLNAWYKTAVGGEEGDSIPFTISSSGAVSSEMSLVFDGATKVAAAFLSGSSANADSPSLTVAYANNLFIAAYLGVALGGADVSDYPSNCPLYRAVSGTTISLGRAGQEVTGTTFDPAAWTSTAGDWGVFTLGLAA